MSKSLCVEGPAGGWADRGPWAWRCVPARSTALCVGTRALLAVCLCLCRYVCLSGFHVQVGVSFWVPVWHSAYCCGVRWVPMFE